MLVTVKYGITKELQEELFVENGQNDGGFREAEIDLDTQALRQAWVTLFGLRVKANITHFVYQDEIKAKYPDIIGTSTFRFKLPTAYKEILTIDEIKMEIIKTAATFEIGLWQAKEKAAEKKADYEANLKLAKPLIERIEATSNLEALQALTIPPEIKGFRARNQLWPLDELHSRAISDAYDAQKDAEREAEKAQYEADKTAWIKAHGSEHLKLVFEGGYEVGRIYTLERAEVEFPDWDIDYQNTTDWKDRKNPTLVELHAEQKASAETKRQAIIVWLISPPRITQDEEEWEIERHEFEECTALVVRGYLGKYDLIKYI